MNRLFVYSCILIVLLCASFVCIQHTSPQSSLQQHILFSVDNTTHNPREVMVFHVNGMALYKNMHDTTTRATTPNDTTWKLCKYTWNPLTKRLQFKSACNTQKILYMKMTTEEEHIPSGYYSHTKAVTYYMYQPNHRQPRRSCKHLEKSTFLFMSPSEKKTPTTKPPIYSLNILDSSLANLKQDEQSDWQTCQFVCKNTREMQKWHVRLHITQPTIFPYGVLLRINLYTKRGLFQWEDTQNIMHVQRVRVHHHQLIHPEA